MAATHRILGLNEEPKRSSPPPAEGKETREGGEHGHGLRLIFDRFRKTKTRRRLAEGARLSSSHPISPMSPLKSRASRPQKLDTAAGASARRAPDTSAASPTETTTPRNAQPNIFSRMLRNARSKKNLKQSRSRPAQSAKAPGRSADLENGGSGQASRPAQGLALRPAASHEPGESLPRAESKAATRHSHVPAHETPVFAPVLTLDHTQHTLDSGEPKTRQLSAVTQASSLDVEHTGYQPLGVPNRISRDDRPLSALTTDTLNYNASHESIGTREAAVNKLQPPPSPLPTRDQHSDTLPPAEDPSHTHEEPSDFQQFVQQAGDGDRQEREVMWNAITNRPGKKKVVLDHPDLAFMNPGSLERSDTFGRSKRDKQGSKTKESSWRRASYRSDHKRDDERRRLSVAGDAHNANPSPDTAGMDYRTRPNATRRLSDFLRPSRA
ncbi:hypothetical protein JX265_012326 [Neoarthrinium moseri]|uniref:Uncharacterized protein n=1 Tax=Neoarthrinium moseri TaxID=1658444 RepID=A0A9P9WAK8_9PEZI|nr:hypothetical protein JX265_012326 [Neoarthrinium moseri]